MMKPSFGISHRFSVWFQSVFFLFCFFKASLLPGKCNFYYFRLFLFSGRELNVFRTFNFGPYDQNNNDDIFYRFVPLPVGLPRYVTPPYKLISFRSMNEFVTL